MSNRILLAIAVLIGASLFATSVVLASGIVDFRGVGRTETTNYNLSARMDHGLGTGLIRLRERDTRVNHIAEADWVVGYDVTGDGEYNLIALTAFDPNLPDFYKYQVIIVGPGVSDVYTNGVIQYRVYEGGLEQYSRTEPVIKGMFKTISR